MTTPEARYTVDGPPGLEARVASDQQRVIDGVHALIPREQLVALILAGGYGRGEGGYRHAGDRCIPYNDYDYFIVVKGLGRNAIALLNRRLHVLGEALGHEFGLEVDFAVFDVARLGNLPACLMYSELKWSHRTLIGDPGVLDAVPSPPVDDLPLAEFSRMMLNRGALLLMNSEALAAGIEQAPGGAERFLRYISKGVLAAGDARLAALGRYHPSTYERARRVAAWCAEDASRRAFSELYTLAVQVKQGGGGAPAIAAPDFASLQARAVSAWLDAFRALESTRLGRSIPDWPDYASTAIPKGQSGAPGPGRALHIARALRGGAGRALRAGPVRLLQHPRERIMAALPLLLEQGAPRACTAAASLGLKSSAGHADLIDAFFADWRRYC